MLHYYKYGNVDNPQKLLFFLHGYDCLPTANLQEILPLVASSRQNCLIVPKSQQKSERHPDRSQWFGLLKHDSLLLRRQPQTPIAKIFSIYDSAQEEISAQASLLNAFITQIQSEYKISDNNTYLIGFSQGAMMALYAGLSRRATIGGIFAMSGLVAGKSKLKSEIHSYPPVYIYHGKLDNVVQYKTLNTSVKWLQDCHINTKVKIYEKLDHRIIADEIDDICQIIACSDKHKLVK